MDVVAALGLGVAVRDGVDVAVAAAAAAGDDGCWRRFRSRSVWCATNAAEIGYYQARNKKNIFFKSKLYKNVVNISRVDFNIIRF